MSSTEQVFFIEDGKLLKYNGPGGYVTIPEGVRRIASGAFRGKDVTRVSIPESVEEIGFDAFRDCRQLIEVKLPKGLRTLEHSAFADCLLLAAISIPEGVKIIDYATFLGCRSLASVELSKGIEQLGTQAFAGCSALTEIDIPEGLVTIGISAFGYCAGLREIRLPEGILEIGHRAFLGCASLNNVKFPRSLRKIGYSAFEECTSLDSVMLPEGLKEFSAQAFCGCTLLKEFSVAEANPFFREMDGMVISSDGQTLAACPPGCTGKIKIPDGVRHIGANVFYQCEEITEVVFPEGLETVGLQAFEGCTKLTRLEFPNSVYCISGNAFQDCMGLKEIRFPQNLTAIYGYAFYKCIQLNQLTLPEGLQEIGARAFDGCPLKNVIYEGKQLKLGVSALGCSDFVFDTPNMAVTGLTSEYRPSACKGFAIRYMGGHELSDSIVEAGLKYIKSQRRRLWRDPVLFRLIAGKKYATQKDIAAWIEEAAKLGKTELSATLLEYRNQNFSSEDLERAQNLELNRQLRWLKTGTLPVSEVKKTWSFKKLENGTLSIISYKGSDLDVVIPVQIGKYPVTAIGHDAFSPQAPRTDKDLKSVRAHIRSVVIPEGVSEIGAYAFAYCGHLECVELPHSLRNIGKYAFTRCTGLRKLIIPPNLEMLDVGLFEGFSNPCHIHLPRSITYIAPVYHNCANLIIHAPKNSYAEEFALKNDIPFKEEEEL